MRIVLKPMGAFTLLLAFAILAVIATLRSPQPVAIVVSAQALASRPTTAPDHAAANHAAANHAAHESEPLLYADAYAWTLVRPTASAARSAYLSPWDLPAGVVRPALAITIVQPTPQQFWLTQLQRIVDAPLKAGHPLHLRFWARSRRRTPMIVDIERLGPPWEKDLHVRVALTPKWKQYDYDCKVTSDRESGKTHVCFQLGETAGHVDIADIVLL